MILAMAYFCSESIYLQFIVHSMLLGGDVCVKPKAVKEDQMFLPVYA